MKEILKKFKNQKIAVIGDLILDKYIYGEVDRISPEAPVPIVRVLREKYVPGGAANVAANISTLGGNPFLFGIVGNDPYKDILLQKTAEMNIPTSGIFTDNNKTTIRKTRVIGLNQQLLRIDHENTDYIETHIEEKFINKLKSIKDLSAILISDYAKGTITKQLMSKLVQFSKENDILLIIDPKPKHKEWYAGSTLITPNKKEAQEMSGIIIESEDDFIKAGEILVNKFDSNVIITAGADGMYVFENVLTPRSSPRLRPDRPFPTPRRTSLSNKEGEMQNTLTPNPSPRGRGEIPLGKGESIYPVESTDSTGQEGVREKDRLSEELQQRHSTTMSGVALHLERRGKSLNTPDSSREKQENISERRSVISHIHTVAREVYDVSGAGDTVIATLTLALSCGAILESAAILANHAAGIKVGKIGTAPIFLEELEKEFQENK